MLNRSFRYYTWVKHTENSNAAPKQPQGQTLSDAERGRDREEHGLVTIFEAKDEADEDTVTLGHWSASRKASDKA
jgi:hypothetical protein